MMNENIKELLDFCYADLQKKCFSRADLTKIMRVFNLCSDARIINSFRNQASERYVMIVEETRRLIEDFAAGRVSIEDDATAAMKDVVDVFGKEYVRKSGELFYQSTPAAAKSILMLKRLDYQNRGRYSVVEKRERNAARFSFQTAYKERRVSFRYRKPEQHFSFLKNFAAGAKNMARGIKKSLSRNIRRYAVAAVAFLSFGNAGISGNGISPCRDFSRKQIETVNVAQPKADVGPVESPKPSGLIVPAAEFSGKLPQFEAKMPAAIQDEIPNAADTSGIETDEYCIVPVSYEYSDLVIKNRKDYEAFVKDLVMQFKENIDRLKDSKTDKNKFYAAQEQLIAKYGKSRHIVRNKSCESMSFATFLSAYEKNNNGNNYIARSCKELLLQVPNPHACSSNKNTFRAKKSPNLQKSLAESLKRNKYGVYMLWTYNVKGGLHRQTIIGTGDGNAYLLAFNNNRIIKMDSEKLERLAPEQGFYTDLGSKIYQNANIIGFEEYTKHDICSRGTSLVMAAKGYSASRI